MKSKIVAIVLVALLASGCAYSNAGDAEELSTFAEKSDNSSYHILYNFSMEGTSLISHSTGEAEIFSYKGRTRFDRFLTFAGGGSRVSIYEKGENSSVRCTKTVEGNNTTNECVDTNSTASRYIDATEYTDPENSVNYAGEREYAGRTCKLYKIGLPPSEFEESEYIRSGAIADICVDKEKGYMAYNSLKLAEPLNISGRQVRNLYTLKAQGYNENVNSDDVRPPENLTLVNSSTS